MALPPMTPEQRADALAKAAAARTERMNVKASLKRGDVTLSEVLANTENSDVIAKTKVAALLESLPGFGKARAQQLMEQIGIDENRRVRGLGTGQRAALLAALNG